MLKKRIGLTLICILLILIPVTVLSAENLAENPSFEAQSGSFPDGWNKWEWKSTSSIQTVTGNAHSGDYYATISSSTENDARLMQTLRLRENSQYRVSCWVRTENVGAGNVGANLSIEGKTERSQDIKGTSPQWTLLEMYLKTGPEAASANITLGLGGYGSTNTGKADFDDFEVTEVEAVPDGSIAINIDNTISANDQPKPAEIPASPSIGWSGQLVMIYILALTLAAAAGLYAFNSHKAKLKLSQNSSRNKVLESDVIPDEDPEE